MVDTADETIERDPRPINLRVSDFLGEAIGTKFLSRV